MGGTASEYSRALSTSRWYHSARRASAVYVGGLVSVGGLDGPISGDFPAKDIQPLKYHR